MQLKTPTVPSVYLSSSFHRYPLTSRHLTEDFRDFNLAPLDFGVTSAQALIFDFNDAGDDVRSSFKSLKIHLHAYYLSAIVEVVPELQERLRTIPSAWFWVREGLEQIERDKFILELLLRRLGMTIESIRRFVQVRKDGRLACAP